MIARLRRIRSASPFQAVLIGGFTALAAFMSLPIIILVLTIARDSAGEAGEAPRATEQALLRFGLRSGAFLYAALLLSFALARFVLESG